MKKLLIYSCMCLTTLFVKAQVNNSVENPFQITHVKPQSIVKIEEGQYFVDFGKAAFGALTLKSKAAITDTIVIHLGEKLASVNAIDKNPGGTIRYQKTFAANVMANSIFRVELKVDKRNSNPPAVALPDTFGVITPFRYCEIENLKIPITDLEITKKMYSWRFNDEASNFSSSDTVLNKIWDMCKYTIKATSFTGYYIDGDRERIPYEADAYINQLGHYCVDSEYELARRTNEYFMTNPTWPTEWILITVPMFYNDYLYTGNIAPLQKYYDALKLKTLSQLKRPDGLITTKSEKHNAELMKSIGFKNQKTRLRDIVDWPQTKLENGKVVFMGESDGYELVNINTVVNAYHYLNMKLMAQIAGVLGKKDDSVYFRKQAVMVRDTINKKLLDKTKGIYVDGEGSSHSALHANLFPLVFGLVPKQNEASVISFIKSRGMACSVYGSQFLLEGLYMYNQADYALELLTSLSDRSWWNMIRTGSTIAMEAWDMKYKPNSDWNHAWGAAPANIVTRNMWGIVPLLPGFVKAQIKPQLAGLIFSKIKVPTIKGAILADYKLVGKTKAFDITIPAGMTADFIWTNTKEQTVFVNNKEIKKFKGAVSLNSGLNKIEIK